MTAIQNEPLVRARLSYSNPTDPLLKKAMIAMIELATGRPKLEKLYNQVRNMRLRPAELWGAALQKLDVKMDFDAAQLAKVPIEGPVVFIANHPFGVVDGLILGHLVSRVRERFAILVNEVICKEEQLADFLLPIDFRETKEALQTNLRSRQETMARLKRGEALAIFPAGGVSTSPKLFGKAEDLEWKRFTIKVIQQTQATVIPIYVHGQNSRLFQIASHISLQLRLSLLLNEIRNKMHKTIRITI
ncbi:MAG: lysophospholipid acyltransferase family protein, partial [Saprospiraceae bacterium]